MIAKLSILFAALLITSGCATLTTASHFTEESPKIYSGTRFDIRASLHDESALSVYRDRYGVTPPDYPKIDLPFSFLFDTIILGPVVLPIVLYQKVFDSPR